MNARILLSFAATAVTALTINVSASEVSFTPRAAGNQIKIVSGTTAAQPALVAQAISPRALDNQATTVAGVASDVNPTSACHSMVASPKAVQVCAEHPTAMSACCQPATADASAH